MRKKRENSTIFFFFAYYLGESKVLQYLGNVYPNSTVPDAFRVV